MKLASTKISKYFLTYRNRTLDFCCNYLSSYCIKVEVHNIEVKTAINSSHKWYIFMPMMSKLMAMTTENTIYYILWQLINVVNDFIILTGLLHSQIVSNIIGFVPGAFVSEMSKYNYYLSSFFSKQFWLFNCYLRIFMKLILRKFTRNKSWSCDWSLSGGKAYYSHFYPVKLKNLAWFVIW